MTYTEAMEFLKNSEQYGSMLGLESIGILLEKLGNPHDKLKFVHIAGTNGKGSTAAYISSILADAGYLVGRYTSPAVFHPHENIQIINKKVNNHSRIDLFDIEYITEQGFIDCLQKIKTVCQQMVEDNIPHPTIFEIETAMAFLYFSELNCDIVVLEVGLGGRLDATNIINTTECAVITSISMDHMQYLGDTLEKITKEKAGIIKQGIPVVSYQQKEEAGKVIRMVCNDMKSDLIEADFDSIIKHKQGIEGTQFSYGEFKDVFIQLLGDYQIKNAVVSLLAINVLYLKGYNITSENVKNGLYHTKWRGRFEVISTNPLFIIDGAHNEDAAIELANNIKMYLPNKRICMIIGVFGDKDYLTVIKETAYLASTVITITPNNSRGLSSEKLAKIANVYCKHVIDGGNVSRSLDLAYDIVKDDEVIIAFGSLSILKEIYDNRVM